MKQILLIFILVFSTSIITLAQDGKLFYAVKDNNLEKVAKLLKKNANPNVFMEVGGGFMKLSPLIQAVMNSNLEIVKLLIEYKAQVDWRDGFNSTALMYAASKGQKEIVEYLIAQGADAKAEDSQGNSVLSAAKESKNAEVVELIENKIKE